MRPDYESALQALAQEYHLDLLILFGSHAKGTASPDSDLDVAVASKQPLDLTELNNAMIQKLHQNKIDVVDLRRCHPVLGKDILKTGKVLVRQAKL